VRRNGEELGGGVESLSQEERMMKKWTDPPPRRAGKFRPWKERLAPLMKRAGDWAVVYRHPRRETVHNVAYRLRSGFFEIPPGEWEFTSRGGKVFARYLGKGGSSA
jgi:hypothetical protein